MDFYDWFLVVTCPYTEEELLNIARDKSSTLLCEVDTIDDKSLNPVYIISIAGRSFACDLYLGLKSDNKTNIILTNLDVPNFNYRYMLYCLPMSMLLDYKMLIQMMDKYNSSLARIIRCLKRRQLVSIDFADIDNKLNEILCDRLLGDFDEYGKRTVYIYKTLTPKSIFYSYRQVSNNVRDRIEAKYGKIVFETVEQDLKEFCKHPY